MSFTESKTIDDFKKLDENPYKFEVEASNESKYQFKIAVEEDELYLFVGKENGPFKGNIKFKVDGTIYEDDIVVKKDVSIKEGETEKIPLDQKFSTLVKSNYVMYGALSFKLRVIPKPTPKKGSFEIVLNKKKDSEMFKSETFDEGIFKVSFTAKKGITELLEVEAKFERVNEDYFVKILYTQEKEQRRSKVNIDSQYKVVVAHFYDFADFEKEKILLTFSYSAYDDENYKLMKESHKNGCTSCSQTESSTTNYNKVYSSKEETGFVGLENQGATCYMNSLLQSLYNLPAFRKIVYDMPTTGTEDEKKSIPLNLQRLFCEMQLGTKACSTKALTTSFGWGSTETFMQHDIEEFNRVLIDNLETKLKGTQLEKSIADLFKGQYRSYIKCRNVDYKSSRDEVFYDLQMVVRNCPDLEASFKLYTSKDELVGDNQYDAGDFGKQDADMGIEFTKFPTVLQLHLNRFEYDYNYDRMIKLNDRFEFPEEIDLTPYLADDVDKSVPSIYTLFGVLVHQGSATFGHYYSFLRPSTDAQWYEFNDSTVTKVEKEKAIDDNFGGDSGSSSSSYSYYWNYSSGKSYSGYMLVYVRKDAAQNVFQPIPDEAIPQHLKDYMNAPKKAESYGYDADSYDVTVTTENDFALSTLKEEKIFDKPENELKFDISKKATNADLYKKVAEVLKVDVDEIRIWRQQYYYNTPNTLILNNDKSIQLDYYYTDIFVQKKSKDEKLDIDDNEIIVYTKFFFPEDEYKLQYLKSIRINKNDNLSTLCEEVNKIMGFPAGTKLSAFTESVDKKAAILEDQNLTLEDKLLSTGSVVIFQLDDKSLYSTTTFAKKTPEDFSSGEKSKKATIKRQASKGIEGVPSFHYNEETEINVTKYFIMNNEILKFYLVDLKDQSKIIAKIYFPTDVKFENLFTFIAGIAKVDYDPEKSSILLYRADYYETSKPNNEHIDISYYKTPKQILYSGYNETRKLFFDFIPDIPLNTLTSYISRRIIYTEDGVTPVFDKPLLVPKDKKIVKEIAEYLINKNIIPAADYDFSMVYRTDMDEFYEPESIIQYECYGLRIEPKRIPHDKAIFVSRGTIESRSSFKPNKLTFLYQLDESKTREDMLKEIKEICKYKDEEFSKLRFMYKKYESYNEKPLPKGELNDILKPLDNLILVEKSKKKDPYSSSESLKIYN